MFDCQENSSCEIDEVMNRLVFLYKESVENIYSGVASTYPYLAVEIDDTSVTCGGRTSYGFVTRPGLFFTTVTQVPILYSYYREQLDRISKSHKCRIFTGRSKEYIPRGFLDESIANHPGPAPSLADINDDIVNGICGGKSAYPLSLFSAQRIDYSCKRLHHYCGSNVEHFQRFILFSNYHSYTDSFRKFAAKCIADDSSEYYDFVEPHGVGAKDDLAGGGEKASVEHLPQMPAYHLKRRDGDGITFINIGIGPSNAKTITDHLAVLRPHCWIMLGHCAGLHLHQSLGDYVLAHAYVRNDAVLDDDLSIDVPIPAIAEVQIALQEAVEEQSGNRSRSVGSFVRTGTVFSTGNRNWELNISEMLPKLVRSRAIAIDMESATLAANGFRFRVPYGTLLCVSDKPIDGEFKLHDQARKFYDQSVAGHFAAGMAAMEKLRSEYLDRLHSRKLRSIVDPPFR